MVIRWRRREQIVPLKTARVSDRHLGLGGINRHLTIEWANGRTKAWSDPLDYETFKAELILRGAREEPERTVTITGTDRPIKTVPVAWALMARAGVELAEAKELTERIVRGERISFRAKTARDAREFRRELRQLGATVEDWRAV